MSLAEVLQIIVAVCALVFAYLESRKWRAELIGKKKIELAIRIGVAAEQIRSAFHTARDPAAREEGGEEDYNRRLRLLREALTQLYPLCWEARVLFKNDLGEYREFYNTQYHTLLFAMRREYQQKSRDEDGEILYQHRESDEFGRQIEARTEKLLDLVWGWQQSKR